MENEQLNEFMQKTASYIETAQAELDVKNAELEKNASARADWAKQATKTAAVLCDRGIIPRDQGDEFAEKLAEDPNYALTFMEKVSKLVGSDQLGRASDIGKESADKNDPFAQAFFPELCNTNSGFVD